MHEKMFNIFRHKTTATQNYTEIPFHPSQNEYHQGNKNQPPPWLKPVILTTREAAIGKITVKGHPEQKVHNAPSQSTAGHSGAQGSIHRRSQAGPGTSETLSPN
jgi:hypothetical protein